MLPDRAKFYDSLKNYNSLQHANKNSMYGLEYDEHSYYKREGEPGNYRYYWTKQEYETHLAELEKQRNKNMQAGQNYEADRWKKVQQNNTKQSNINKNQGNNPEADRYKRQQAQQLREKQIKEAQERVDEREAKAKEDARQKIIDKNQGNDGESERWKRYEAQKLREKQIKDAQERVKQREQEKIAKKNEGNDPEADRWKKKTEPQKSYSTHESAEKKSQESGLKYNKEVDEIREATQRLRSNDNISQDEYNKGKTERQNKLKEAKEDLFDMTNYYREKNGNEDFDKSFEEAKKSAGVENLYIHGGDIKYYDKELEDKISDMKSKMSELGRKNGELESRNSNSNIDSRTKASNENQYQTNLNEIRKLEREIELTESEMKQKAYSAYEQVLDQMYSNKENGQSLQTARERKQLEHEQWVKEQEGDWIDQIKKKAKKFFS